MASRGTRVLVAILFVAMLLPSGAVLAADISWNTTAASNDWADTDNWSSGTIPTYSDALTFTTSNYTAVLNRDTFVSTITFAANAADFSFSHGGTGPGGGTMFFSGGILVNGGSQTFNAAVRANGKTFSVLNNGTGKLDFNSAFMSNNDKDVTATIGGSGNIEFRKLSRRSDAYDMEVIKTGTGTVYILEEFTTPATASEGAITGTMTINEGTLNIVGEGCLGVGPAAFNAAQLTLNGGTLQAARSFTIDDANRGITIGASGGTFDVGSGLTLTIANPIAGSGALRKTGDGALALAGIGLATTAIEVDEGAMTIADGLTVGDVRIGFDGGEASLAVTAGNVAMGTASDRANLYVGRTTGDPVTYDNSEGILDLAGVAQFTAYLDKFEIGVRTSSGNNSYAVGSVTLAALNYIDASEVLISQNAMWYDPAQSALTLGESNTIKTDTFIVGGNRGNALVEFGAAGGTLALDGSGEAAADLYVGYCTMQTGNPTTAVMDLSGGAFNATLDTLLVGLHAWRADQTPVTTATLSFDAGEVRANDVTIGEGTVSGSNEGKGIGTLNMGGGSFLVANSIELGMGSSVSEGTFHMTGGATTVTGSVLGGIGSSTVKVEGGALNVTGTVEVDSLTLSGAGTLSAGAVTVASGATFDFAGGTLSVDTFNGDLLQSGGTLAPGNSPGTTIINGDYTLGTGGTLEIDIEGLTAGSQYDQLVVSGDVSLAGELSVLLDAGYSPTYNDLFWIVNNMGESTTTSGMFDGIDQGEAFPLGGRSFFVYYGANYETQAFYGGNDVLLTTIPEPSTLVMLLGLLGLIGFRRRR